MASLLTSSSATIPSSSSLPNPFKPLISNHPSTLYPPPRSFKLPPTASAATPPPPPSPSPLLSAGLAALAAALLVSTPPSLAAAAPASFQTYFGTAASASSYGGYGGNVNKRDTAEYVYDVPQGWKERLISKIEKGTNGTDSEFYNPRRKNEKVYVTFLAGFRRLAPRDTVLSNLALSDVNLQDMIASADKIQAIDKTDPAGQLYYVFEIDSPVAHSLISVTCAKNKLYAHFVNAPSQDWAKDESLLRHVHESFSTVGGIPLESVQV